MRDGSRGNAIRRRRLSGGCLACLLAALAFGLFSAFAGLSVSGHDPRLLWYQAQRVDTLEATYTLLSGDRTLPLPAQVVTNARPVQALYNAAFALPAEDLFAHEGCTLGIPLAYHLAFARGKEIVALVDVDLSGCGSVSLAGIATRQVTQPFMQMIASTLHEPVATLEQPGAYPLPSPAPTYPMMMLTVHRVGETPTTPVTTLSVVITDPAVVFALDNDVTQYSALGGPQPPPSGACPPNNGVLYRLSFYQDGVNFAVKDIEATGCQLIYTHDGFPPIYHISTPAFWDALASALGVPVASLGVGPIAPYWTTPPTIPASPPR